MLFNLGLLFLLVFQTSKKMVSIARTRGRPGHSLTQYQVGVLACLSLCLSPPPPLSLCLSLPLSLSLSLSTSLSLPLSLYLSLSACLSLSLPVSPSRFSSFHIHPLSICLSTCLYLFVHTSLSYRTSFSPASFLSPPIGSSLFPTMFFSFL